MTSPPAPLLSRRGLRFRVLNLVGAGVLIPAALVGWAAWSRLGELDERLVRGREGAAVAVAEHFDDEVTQVLEELQRIASAATGDLAAGRAESHRDVLHRAYLGFHLSGGTFLLDDRGRLLVEEPRHSHSAAPPPDLPDLQEVLRSGRPAVSALIREGGASRIYALVPARDWSGKVAGVAGGILDPGMTRQAPFLRHLVRVGGYAEVVDREGTVLASTQRERVRSRTACPPLAAQLIRERRSHAGRCRECHLSGAEPLVLAFAPLAHAPWGVAVVQPESAVLATSGSIPSAVPAFALGVLLIAGAFAWGAARSVIRPVEVLTREAERIAAGGLDTPIPDVGADEVGRLGRSLDGMRASLADLLGQLDRARAELEVRVETRTRELAEANRALRVREGERARLLRTVITAQEDERRRIARELHDETTQGLAVLVMGLEQAGKALREGGPTPRLDEVKALAVHLLDEVHRLILDLRPSVLDDLGLFSAVSWYAERYLGERGVAVRCELGPAPATRLPHEVETAVFRICQEAIHNIARHAQAESALIQLEYAGGELRFEIEDDGRGFDTAAAAPDDRPHYGLLGIRERAEILGGTALIESAPGKGTRVVVRVPLPAQGDSAGQGGENRAGGSAP